MDMGVENRKYTLLFAEKQRDALSKSIRALLSENSTQKIE
jgi:hypothetical protein